MNNPRDFLPAKYKKNQKNELKDLPVSIEEKEDVKTEEIFDSPWSNLAKEPKIPDYKREIFQEEIAKDKDNQDFSATLNNNDSIETEEKNTPKSAFVPKKKKNLKLAGILVVLFLVVGVFSSYMLSQQSQDNRNQASGECPPADPYCNDPPSNVDPNRFGWCGTCSPPRPATEADWANMNVQISGTYVWNGMRYIIDLPATHEAAIDYAVQWNGINDYVGDPDGVGDIELAPFYMCGDGDAYNVVNCTTEANLCSVIENGRCYLTMAAYEAEQALGHTWVPDGTGCGDGVHDTIDCQEWHFTTCLNQGSGVNGYGCDAETTTINECEDGDCDDNPPTEPPTEPPTGTPSLTCGELNCTQNSDCGTGLVCQSVTISGQAKKICAKPENNLFCAASPTTDNCCGTQTQPVCASIEMLDSTNTAMTAEDDAKLKSGDEVRFRCSATGNQDIAFDYQFRVWAPDTNFWTNITDTSGTVAKNVSDSYVITNPGHYVAQGRICVGTECQAWELVTGSPATTSANPN